MIYLQINIVVNHLPFFPSVEPSSRTMKIIVVQFFGIGYDFLFYQVTIYCNVLTPFWQEPSKHNIVKFFKVTFS